MPRPSNDPSGPTRPVTIGLNPAQRAVLDELAQTHGSRSAAIAYLLNANVKIGGRQLGKQAVLDSLDGVEGPVPPRTPRPVPPAVECQHRDKAIISGGMARCRDCQATRGTDGTWRSP